MDLGRWVLAAVAILLLLAIQAHHVPVRLQLVTAAWAQLQQPEAATRGQVIGPEIVAVLAAIQDATPPSATIILVTRDALAHGPRSPYVLYHRALERLYPRRVLWAVLEGSPRRPQWWTVVADTAALPAFAAAHGASALVAVDVALDGVGGPRRLLAEGVVMVAMETAR